MKYYIAASVAALTFAVYLSSLQNEFLLWDDDVYIFENPFIRSFGPDFFRRAFGDFYAGNWHPLTWISHAVDYAVWGLNPLGHHLTNNILHAVNAFLVVLLGVRLLEAALAFSSSLKISPDPSLPKRENILSPTLEKGDGRGFSDNSILIAAATTGLLFGLHPLHVESVAWVSERKDLLCALFFMLSIMSYLSSITPPLPSLLKRGWRSRGRYILSLIFFTLALLSKPMAVTLPVVLLILDWYPLGRIQSLKSLRAVFFEKVPFIALSLVSAVLTVLAQRSGGTIRSIEFASLSTRVLVGFKSLIMYLWKMVLPVDLIPFYPYPKEASFLSIEYLSAIVLVLGITIACAAVAKKQKLWLAAWGYYVITLLPVLGIVQVGRQSMADRYTYLPGLGPLLLLGIAAAWVWTKIQRSGRQGLAVRYIGVAVSVVVIVSLSYMTFKQTRIWRDSFVFWSYVIEKEPDKVPDAYNNRGSAFYKKGLTDKAIEDFDRAIALDPAYYEAYNNRGTAFVKMGMFDRALADLDRAISLKPGQEVAYLNRGRANFLMERYDLAEEDFNRAILLKEDYAVAYLNRGTLYFVIGKRELALPDFQRACVLGSAEGCARFARIRFGG